MTIKVSVTDDHPMVLAGLSQMLATDEHIEILGKFLNGEQLLKGLEVNLPDVLLLDIQMPGMTGNALAKIISKKYPSIAILAITSMNTSFHVNDMINHGCKGFLLKNADVTTLLHAVRELYAGREFIQQSLKDDMQHSLARERQKTANILPSLTSREKEILQLVIAGLTSQQIAAQLFLSFRTVQNHRFSLQQKLNVKNNTELVKLALQNGLATL